MKIALIGATGFVGSCILTESLRRGHKVTALVRDTSKLPVETGLESRIVDAADPLALTPLLAGHDLVVSAINPGAVDAAQMPRSIVDATKRSGVRRLLVVGGAGTLEVAAGKRIVDQPDFPAQWKDGALKTAAFLELLRAEETLDWVFISPAAMLQPGTRTGQYRVGGDQLLTDAEGQSRISLEDYAVAMLDEIEKPAHSRARFSVAY